MIAIITICKEKSCRNNPRKEPLLGMRKKSRRGEDEAKERTVYHIPVAIGSEVRERERENKKDTLHPNGQLSLTFTSSFFATVL